VLGEDELGGWLVPLDFAWRVLNDGLSSAWTSGNAILADGGLAEGFASSPVWVDVNVDVGDTHCEC